MKLVSLTCPSGRSRGRTTGRAWSLWSLSLRGLGAARDLGPQRAANGGPACRPWLGTGARRELNGYPGPLHVLELADRLRLIPEQKYRVQRLFESMKGEAIAAGANLIASERELDQLFATHTMTAARMTSLLAQIGERQGELRAVHLKYHLATAELLSDGQKQSYAELRGYQRCAKETKAMISNPNPPKRRRRSELPHLAGYC